MTVKYLDFSKLLAFVDENGEPSVTLLKFEANLDIVDEVPKQE